MTYTISMPSLILLSLSCFIICAYSFSISIKGVDTDLTSHKDNDPKLGTYIKAVTKKALKLDQLSALDVISNYIFVTWNAVDTWTTNTALGANLDNWGKILVGASTSINTADTYDKGQFVFRAIKMNPDVSNIFDKQTIIFSDGILGMSENLKDEPVADTGNVLVVYITTDNAHEITTGLGSDQYQVFFPPGIAFYILKKFTKVPYQGGSFTAYLAVDVTSNDPRQTISRNTMTSVISKFTKDYVNVQPPPAKKREESTNEEDVVQIKQRHVSVAVPSTWVCYEGYYASDDGCDCDCGAYDPDCDTDTDPYCDYSGSCDPTTGACPSGIPSSWTCPQSYFNSLDGCDCGCGAHDPDCDDPSQYIINCDHMCDSNGNCVVNIPSGWTCDNSTYADGAYCNCDCGTPDPDCPTSFPYDACNDTSVCINGHCTIVPMVPDTWICDPTYYDETSYFSESPGCDCDCGGVDPDCMNASAPIYGCPCPNMACLRGFCVGNCQGYKVELSSVPGAPVLPGTPTMPVAMSPTVPLAPGAPTAPTAPAAPHAPNAPTAPTATAPTAPIAPKGNDAGVLRQSVLAILVIIFVIFL